MDVVHADRCMYMQMYCNVLGAGRVYTWATNVQYPGKIGPITGCRILLLASPFVFVACTTSAWCGNVVTTTV